MKFNLNFRYLIMVILMIFFITACGSNSYVEPENIDGCWVNANDSVLIINNHKIKEYIYPIVKISFNLDKSEAEFNTDNFKLTEQKDNYSIWVNDNDYGLVYAYKIIIEDNLFKLASKSTFNNNLSEFKTHDYEGIYVENRRIILFYDDSTIASTEIEWNEEKGFFSSSVNGINLYYYENKDIFVNSSSSTEKPLLDGNAENFFHRIEDF